MPRDYTPPRPTGSTPEARFMQWVWDSITKLLKLFSSSTVKVNFTSRGIYLTGSQKGATQQQTSGGAQRFRVKGIHADYLACVYWDGTTEGAAVNIAKVPEQRESLSSEKIADTATGTLVTVGYTYVTLTNIAANSRVAAASGRPTQYEIIIPVWHTNSADDGNSGVYSEIWADEPEGGTGVSVSGTPLTWMDQNRAGRGWCQYA